LLKLRYVVLNIDPWSRTSPKAIIDRWNDRNNKFKINMTIVTMRDSEYVEDYAGEMEKIEKAKLVSSNTEYEYGRVKTLYHRKRQKLFYKSCSKHLIHQNKSWTSYHDTDEFLTFSDSSQKMEEPGYVLHKLNEIKNRLPPDTHVNDTGVSCLVVNRRRYCAKESSTEETNELFSPSLGGIVPEGFMNSSIDSTDDDHTAIIGRFDTLRYKYLTRGLDGNPKSFIDLSQRNPKLYVQDQWDEKKERKPHDWSVHKAMSALCYIENRDRLSEFKRMVNEERFIVSHYLGSFESYSFRNDARQGGLRTYAIWKERANETKGEVSQAIRPWLRGFVELVGGPNVASYLLQDAGKFPDGYDVKSRINDYNSTYDYNDKKIQRQKQRQRRQTQKQQQRREKQM